MRQTKYRIFCSVLCALLLLSAAACKQQPEEISSESSRVQESSASVAEKTPEPTSTPTPEPEPSPSLSETESSAWSGAVTSGEDGGTEYLPPVETENEPFRTAFSGNAIDSQFVLEYSTSTSLNLMIQACNSASERWKAMIDIIYNDVLELSTEADRNSIKASQEEWAAGAGEELQKIRDAAEEASGGTLEAARNTMLFYRERAAQLCEIQYAINGTLPDFEAELPEEEAKG